MTKYLFIALSGLISVNFADAGLRHFAVPVDGRASQTLENAYPQSLDLAKRLAYQIACPSDKALQDKSTQLWYLKKVFDYWKLQLFNMNPDQVESKLENENAFSLYLETELKNYGLSKLPTDFINGVSGGYTWVQNRAIEKIKNLEGFREQYCKESPCADNEAEKSLSLGASRISGSSKDENNKWWPVWSSGGGTTTSAYDSLWRDLYQNGFQRGQQCNEENKNSFGYKDGFVKTEGGREKLDPGVAAESGATPPAEGSPSGSGTAGQSSSSLQSHLHQVLSEADWEDFEKVSDAIQSFPISKENVLSFVELRDSLRKSERFAFDPGFRKIEKLLSDTISNFYAAQAGAVDAIPAVEDSAPVVPFESVLDPEAEVPETSVDEEEGFDPSFMP